MRLRVSKTAVRDLDSIFDYWARRATPDIAANLLKSIEERFALLAESPHIGRLAAGVAPGVRVFPAGKYLIYYRKARSILSVLHVFHGARDQQAAFNKD